MEIAVLIVVLGLFALDPVLTWAKRKLLGQTAPPFQPPIRTYRAFVWAFPAAAVVTSAIAYARLDFPAIAALFVLALSLMCARYFQNRAAGRIATLPGMVVQPDDPDYANDQHDLVATLIAVAIVAMPLVLPAIAHSGTP